MPQRIRTKLPTLCYCLVFHIPYPKGQPRVINMLHAYRSLVFGGTYTTTVPPDAYDSLNSSRLLRYAICISCQVLFCVLCKCCRAHTTMINGTQIWRLPYVKPMGVRRSDHSGLFSAPMPVFLQKKEKCGVMFCLDKKRVL